MKESECKGSVRQVCLMYPKNSKEGCLLTRIEKGKCGLKEVVRELIMEDLVRYLIFTLDTVISSE